ncbi:MAG: hypothetical protein ONB31_00405 [candidate division KSB1 bacterium]|nr:hypothetical protein [candidate division KSB1 bacterium]MDZ7335099.1 hypothetical protein [candidate division KSB1 bacterium]MDZ7356232.1 hypothetical protein [candidate division KSB1 bacterium]MDZ7400037.1 hypothetical protein [candidate division KSB1 bacterium]
MRSKLFIIAAIVALIFACNDSANTAPKNELTMRFIKVLNINSRTNVFERVPGETQITPLFIRSSKKGDIDLTMLIAYDERVTKLAQQILNKPVTPLIFSVSTMPFVNDNFAPESLVFEQNGRKWSPSNHPESNDMFPIDDDVPFGGPISDTQIHQGVILLPSYFDMSSPIEINYKTFRKMCLLK